MTGRSATAPRKLLVVALDAASPELLRSWAADGTLPTYAGLLARGLAGDNFSMDGLESATWPNFYTGVTPAVHGYYWPEQLKPGTYRTRNIRPRDLRRRRPFWDLLSDAGRRVLVLDVPIAGLSSGLDGSQVQEWGTHDPTFGFATTPARFKARILRSVGPHPWPQACDAPRRSLAEYRHFADQLIEGARLKGRLTRELLASESWDFAIQVFSEPHCAGHQLWHFHDPTHPAFDAGVTASSGNLLREVYAAVDRALGELLTAVAPGTVVMVLTLHGMSYMSGRAVLLPEVLTRLGVLTPASEALPASAPSESASDRMMLGLRRVYHKVPRRMRRPLYEWRQRIKRRWFSQGETIPFDPHRSQCFPLGLGRAFSGIRLNVAGREPRGILAPGGEAERFREQLIRDLVELTDPVSGRPVARRVYRIEELCNGELLDTLPDVVIAWDQAEPLGSTVVGSGAGAIARARSPRIGTLEVENPYCRTGDHLLSGCFVAVGPGIAPGRLGRTVSNLELAPTFARILGCEIPWDGGTPIGELSGA